MLFVDRLGRRKIMMIGAMVMGTAMLLCGIVMGATGEVSYDPVKQINVIFMGGNKSASYFCIVMIYFFVAGFAASWGPVGWIYPVSLNSTMEKRMKGKKLTSNVDHLGWNLSHGCPC